MCTRAYFFFCDEPARLAARALGMARELQMHDVYLVLFENKFVSKPVGVNTAPATPRRRCEDPKGVE